MSAKDLLIAHGEKAAVSLTLLLCAFEVWSVTTDTSIRPENVSPAKIAEQNAGIDKIFIEGKPPTLKPVPDYLGDMKQRFGQNLIAPVVDAWLTAPPDRGPSARGLLAYVYEAPAPTISASDAVGKVALKLDLPASTRPPSHRLSDALVAEWKRPEENISNHAQVIGWKLEIRVGDGEWRPFVGGAAVAGMVPLAAVPATGIFLAEGLEPWVRHSFRASLVVKATGPDVGKAAPAQAVLVLPGRMPGEDVNWAELSERLRQADPVFLARFAKPLAGPTPDWAAIQSGEHLYIGAPSDEVTVSVTSDVRFAFEKVATDVADPTKETIHLLVTRMTTAADGTVSWLPEPKVIKAVRGQTIAGEVEVKSTKGIVRVKLDTGFRVLDLKRDQKRILYYEVREKARVGTKGKDLEIITKEASADVLVVENVRSKNRMELVRLGTIRRPAKADAIIYPAQADPILNEEEAFRKQPGEFRQSGLIPVPPRFHEPGTGPLLKVRAEHPGDESFYETDGKYVELADGRLVWYEPINRKVRQWPEAEVRPAPTDAAAPAATPAPNPAVPAGAPAASGAPPKPAPVPPAGGVHAPPPAKP